MNIMRLNVKDRLVAYMKGEQQRQRQQQWFVGNNAPGRNLQAAPPYLLVMTAGAARLCPSCSVTPVTRSPSGNVSTAATRVLVRISTPQDSAILFKLSRTCEEGRTEFGVVIQIPSP